MGVFDDKKFEQLDWVSQITETIDSEVNGLLARLPDRLKIEQSALISFMDSGYNGLRLSVGNVVRHLVRNTEGGKTMSWDDTKTIIDCFAFEITQDLVLDLENNTLEGEVFLVKTISTIEDDELQKTLGIHGIAEISRMGFKPEYLNRTNEIMEIIGGMEEAVRGRNMRKKRIAIIAKLTTIFQKNEWRIRDATLANKIGTWIAQYIEYGNLAALSNFCKVKVMTHQNMPIYSIEEQQ